MLQPTQELKTFLEVVFQSLNNKFLEVRMFPARSEINLKPIQYFYSSKDEIINAFPELLNKQPKGYGVYIGVCPRNEKKGTKESVSRVHVLWADLDGKSFTGNKEEALKCLKGF